MVVLDRMREELEGARLNFLAPIRNRWPTDEEIADHPEGEAGWWALSWADGEVVGVHDGEPMAHDGLGVRELRREGKYPPPDVAMRWWWR